MQRTKAHVLIVLLLTLVISLDAAAQELTSVMSLRGKWKFTLGDDMRWAKPGFRDSDWDEIRVPGSWEDQGYPGYDGYAWYRLHFTVEENLRDRQLYLRVGYVDDASEVYLNGHLVGFEGQFPPAFITAYNIARAYIIPHQYLNHGGDNLIAVRVYDYRLVGGITHGSVGLYAPKNPLEPEYNLAGVWKFRTGDNLSWAQRETPDEQWDEIEAPGYWETQGFRNYDGFAWYRKEFRVPEDLTGKELVLLLGKIDDFDETYLNGKIIGSTGRMRKNWTPKDWGDEYTRLRAYEIPPDLIVPGQVNTVAVRVLDVYMHGGIYDGPIGLVERRKFIKVEREDGHGWNIFDWFR
jgi:sialate O-acetylesterase